MIKAIVRTVVLVAIILVLSQQVPLVAQYQIPLLIGAIALGIFGFIIRILLLVAGVFIVWLLLMNFL